MLLTCDMTVQCIIRDIFMPYKFIRSNELWFRESHYIRQLGEYAYEESSRVTHWGRNMMTSSNGNIFRVIGHLFGNSPVNSPPKGQWLGALMFSLLCAWINGLVNNGETGDLRCHRAHYVVTVMNKWPHTILQALPLYFFKYLNSNYNSSKGWSLDFHWRLSSIGLVTSLVPNRRYMLICVIRCKIFKTLKCLQNICH